MAQQENDWGKRWGQIVGRAWADGAFKRRLLADPTGVLRENGLAVPPGVQVRVVEDTDRAMHLTLPQKPSSEELVEEDLKRIAGGVIRIMM
jgi:hypothetical protein